MKAYTDKSKIIDTIGDHVGGNRRPILFASSSRRRQHLPTPPRQKLRGSIGSSCFGCARYDLRSKERSRLSVPLSQYAPNDSARVGEGRSGGRGRVLSQSLLVARERRRREPGYNPVIDTTTLTSGEGHVVDVGTSQRVRKILAGVPASVVHPGPDPGAITFREASASIGLLVTDQFVTTIYEASAEIRRRRKFKIVHAKRPG